MKLPKVLRKEYLKNKFDLVHFNGISYWFRNKKILDIPQVLTVHHITTDATKHNNLTLTSTIFDISGENSFFTHLIEKRAITSVDKIIAVSEFTKNQIIKCYM
ncbi:glycosyltransferase family 4 protein [Methanobacterium sp. SMA-27]|uniref:glycosyltransferase family 4 protein n=1 Tax=Methanobacterium sp. SMA-27 TaxID=1495336 RepID=UPI0018CF5EBF|nr:glycosyltransferase family 4 protein [Methanobacterium sp. SMA-27]